mgnify:CR=1 FL=1
MDSPVQDVNGEQPGLNAFGKFVTKFLQYGSNASNNLQDTFSSLTPKQWLRLIAIVGGYMLLRPYLMKWGIKSAVKNLEEEDAKEKEKAKITPNELRGAYDLIEEQDEEDLGDGTSTDWGSKARVRQRTILKQMMEAEERKRREEDSDEDIKEYLED